MRTGVQTSGFADLERTLAAMPGKIAKRATGRAMRDAARLVADKIELLAPRGPTGNLKNSITVKLRNRNLTGLAEYRDVMRAGGGILAARGAMKSARSGGDSAGTRVLVRVAVTAPHAHLVEYGTAARYHNPTGFLGKALGRKGKFVGRMPANPFARPAWDLTAMPALNRIKAVLTTEIAKAAKGN